MPFVEGAAHVFQTGVVQPALVDFVDETETFLPEALDGLLVDVEDHGLERQRPIAAQLRGLRILDEQIPVGNHVVRGDLSGGIHHAGRSAGLDGAQKRNEHQLPPPETKVPSRGDGA